MKFSILTATYNRAKYLPKLYKSIVKNLNEDYDVEWLVMDDGSTDDTEQIIKNFIDEEIVNVRYYKQDNQGKMQAINNLSKYVTGDLWIEIDSDDYFLENAFYSIAKRSEIFNKNDKLYALVFLRNVSKGILSGKEFKEQDCDTTMFDLYFKKSVIGEKILVFKSDIRKKYTYRIEPGERFCTEARLHHKLDLKYYVRCYNDVVAEGEYQMDGYTKNINKLFFDNPKGYYNYFKEILEHNMNGVTMKKRLYVLKHFIMFSYMNEKKIKLKFIKGFANKLLLIILLIPGIIKTRMYISKYHANG